MGRVKISPRILHLQVPNITNLDEFWSPDVNISGIPWKIKVLKTYETDETYLGVYLFCELKDKQRDWTQATSARVKLLSDEYPIEKFLEPDVFDISDQGYGFKSMINWCDLMNPTKGYLDTANDSIYLDIAIKTLDPIKKIRLV